MKKVMAMAGAAVFIGWSVSAMALGVCVPGMKVEVQMKGSWQPATVIKEGRDLCFVDFGDNVTEWAQIQNVRPVGSVNKEAAAEVGKTPAKAKTK